MFKHELLRKKMYLICCLLMGVLILNIFAPMVHAASKSNSELEIEVYVNNFGIDYLENIALDDGTKVGDYDYTVKYVPMRRINTSLGEYFNSVAWITKSNGELALSVDPKGPVRVYVTERDTAWNVLSSPTIGVGGSSNWQNGQVMRWQYDCHFYFAGLKDTWNLEPHRTADSYLDVVKAGCNP